MFVVTICFGKAIPECNVVRITVPLAEKDEKTTCAASFMYGTYAQNPKSVGDMLKSDHLSSRFELLPENNRRQYPEYTIMKYYEELRNNNIDRAVNLFIPGKTRDKKKTELSSNFSKMEPYFQKFKQVVFLDKSYFGPYVRISFFLREPPDANGSGRKGKGFPGALYLKLVENQYSLTDEISSDSLFSNIVSYFGTQTIIQRKEIKLKSDTNGMKCVVLDVDTNSVTFVKSKDSSEISDNDLCVYFNCQSVNKQLIIGEKQDDLSSMMQFFKTAISAYQDGNESEILSTWSGESREYVLNLITQLKGNGEWPKYRHSPFCKTTLAVAVLPTTESSIVYYMCNKQAASVAIYGDGINNPYLLSHMVYLSNESREIFRNRLFINALVDSYMSK
jgi:hypothetical protein